MWGTIHASTSRISVIVQQSQTLYCTCRYDRFLWFIRRINSPRILRLPPSVRTFCFCCINGSLVSTKWAAAKSSLLKIPALYTFLRETSEGSYPSLAAMIPCLVALYQTYHLPPPHPHIQDCAWHHGPFHGPVRCIIVCKVWMADQCYYTPSSSSIIAYISTSTISGDIPSISQSNWFEDCIYENICGCFKLHSVAQTTITVILHG